MRMVVARAQVIAGDVSVDLCCRQGNVPQQLLHGTQIDRYVSRSLSIQILPPLNGDSEHIATIAVIHELVPAPWRVPDDGEEVRRLAVAQCSSSMSCGR